MTELVEIDFTVSIQVDLIDQAVPNGIVLLCHLLLSVESRQSCLYFLGVDSAATVCIEQAESQLELLVSDQRVLVDRSDNPLGELDFTVAVKINLVKDSINLFSAFLRVGREADVELFTSDLACSRDIERVEGPLELIQFFRRRQVVHNVGDSSLLEAFTCLEPSNLGQSLRRKTAFLSVPLKVIMDPRVVEGLLRRDTKVGIFGEEQANEIDAF